MSSDLSYDAAIIGGGLAGLTLSIQLADAGYKVILFEKHKFPFHKVCGEYVSNESRAFLLRCGLDVTQMQLPQIRRLHVSSPSGRVMKHELEQGGFGISRFVMDQKLAEIARVKGVKLCDDCRVSDVTFENDIFHIAAAGKIIEARLCIGAWGKKSNMDSRLGRSTGRRGKNYVGIKYHVDIDFPDDLIELHNFRDGYCGISKVESNRYCLCYLSDSENLKRFNGDIRQMEKEVLMKNPFLQKYFSEANFLFLKPLAVSNIEIGYKSAVKDHILMAGDSAGSIAPLSGNGMSMAMRSSAQLAVLAGEFLAGKIGRAAMEKKYEQFWRSSFKTRVGISKFLQSMLRNTSMTDAALSVLRTIPALRKRVVRATHGAPF